MDQRPLEGVTLETIVTELVEQYGWEKLGSLVNIRCFTLNPSIKSSLTFLRRTPWARTKVEAIYLRHKRATARRTRASASRPQ